MPQDHRSSKDDFPLAEAQKLYQELKSYQKVADKIDWSFATVRRKLQAADSGEVTFVDMAIETVDLAAPTPQSQTKKIKLADLCLTAGTQMREHSHDLFTVADYAEAMREGATFPPIIVFSDGVSYWLADGFQRVKAAQQMGSPDISADIRPGTLREAIFYSCGANSQHGLRRTNSDKRKAVRTMLADTEWSELSDRRIAEICGVTHPFVAEMRNPKDKVVTVTTQMNEDERNTPQDVSERATGEREAEQSVLYSNTDSPVTAPDVLPGQIDIITDERPNEHNMPNEQASSDFKFDSNKNDVKLEAPSPRLTWADVRPLLTEALAQLRHLGDAAHVEGYAEYVDLQATLTALQQIVGQEVDDE